MASNLTAQIQATLGAILTGGSGIGAQQFSPGIATILNIALANGTGANKSNQLFSKTLTIANGASQTLNVNTLGGNDPVGNAYSMLCAKLIIVMNLSATETDILEIGGEGTANAWTSPFGSNTDLLTVNGGGSIILADAGALGYIIGIANNNLLKLANAGAAPFDVNVIIIGATATS